MKRTPEQVLASLSKHYGQRFSGSYLQALALMAREQNEGLDAVRPVLESALEKQQTLKSGSHLSGQLAFCGLAKTNSDARLRVMKAANLGLENGEPKPAMPFHNEMSDAVFMSCPILCHAAKLSKQPLYFDVAWNHLNKIREFCLRPDGLYQHSPLDEAAWGRGNGFPALGLSMCLDLMPTTYTHYDEIKSMQLTHLRALLPHQDENGMWHQVVDHPESYAEFTCTCMISIAAIRAMRKGWLDKSEWQSTIDKSWQAILGRISLDGKELNGCCTGTGKQKNIQAYFDRKEIHGPDERGSAMAMLFALEMVKGY